MPVFFFSFTEAITISPNFTEQIISNTEMTEKEELDSTHVKTFYKTWAKKSVLFF